MAASVCTSQTSTAPRAATGSTKFVIGTASFSGEIIFEIFMSSLEVQALDAFEGLLDVRIHVPGVL
eukprot:CAMPEP_0204050770 /NCGR_PEP_ID=MMETSP0360-20130528/121062_1 /ASSEMBLY_ACC=CAM_ASM_000342 /TAXON_ID=268821 /ORGANISM="Scrippsiella Hangoei, Strain SHTV-5" /LENGTH=65 /DNA_ID=CAMNT_0050997767 /DNA_START=57 /DNA_END=250 /DNA_ORIENTATION=+